MLELLSLLLILSVTAQASTVSPNMSLVIPQVGDQDYPTSISNSFTLMDTHDHSTGKGVVLGTNAVPTAAIQASAVTTAKILDSNVTAAKLATDSVTTAKILDANVTTAKIADANVTTAKIADGNVTQAKRVALGEQVSASSGSFTTVSTSLVDVTNLSVSITTTGRPVFLTLISDGSGSNSGIGAQNAGSVASVAADFVILRGATEISRNQVFLASAASSKTVSQAGNIAHIDPVAAGSYTYKVQIRNASGGGTTATAFFLKLVAYEL